MREQQALSVVAAIEELVDVAAGSPPILIGLFNTTSGSSTIRFLIGDTSLHGEAAFFQDAWEVGGDGTPGVTWDQHNP